MATSISRFAASATSGALPDSLPNWEPVSPFIATEKSPFLLQLQQPSLSRTESGIDIWPYAVSHCIKISTSTRKVSTEIDTDGFGQSSPWVEVYVQGFKFIRTSND